MDSARFGRVLGVGTRLAGKTLRQAIDAAAAENPTTKSHTPPRAPEPVVLPPRWRPAQTTRQQAQVTRIEAKRLGGSVWRPFARASGVLWLEVTGVFFGLVALAGMDGVWLNRSALHWTVAAQDTRLRLGAATIVAIVFGYFCLSSFAQANRRGKS